MAIMNSIKLCECGCGQQTRICNRTRPKYGYIAGHPLRFINGHNKRTHGMSYSRIYKIWTDMLDRCRNPEHHAFPIYGGRGITVCWRWLKFETFLADMGERPDHCSLDRLNNDGPYQMENCRWATPKEQANNRRNSIVVNHDGLTLPLSLWAERLGILQDTLMSRYFNGDRPPHLFRPLESQYSRKR